MHNMRQFFTISGALDKREYLVIIRDNFLLILHKNICCDPSSEPGCHDETVHMRGHNIWF